MDKETAKQILAQSITNLNNRKGIVNSQDLQAEVINNACYYYLKNQKDKASKANSIEASLLEILNATKELIPNSKAFTEAAMELFPNHYGMPEAINATMGIQQNVAWDGMWEFLIDYFQKNHGIQIDEGNYDTAIFNSTKHMRFENGELTSESAIERIIRLDFSKDKNEIIISIEQSLSPKKAYIKNIKFDKYIYEGADPDYVFNVFFGDFGEVIKFTLKMPNRNLKIVYFE
jgi:hypothetical protein